VTPATLVYRNKFGSLKKLINQRIVTKIIKKGAKVFWRLNIRSFSIILVTIKIVLCFLLSTIVYDTYV
jgi:hypothetical protein